MYDIRSEIPHRGGTKERGVEAPRLLAQARRFVKIFCAVLRSTFVTILPLKNPFQHPFGAAFMYLRVASILDCLLIAE